MARFDSDFYCSSKFDSFHFIASALRLRNFLSDRNHIDNKYIYMFFTICHWICKKKLNSYLLKDHIDNK